MALVAGAAGMLVIGSLAGRGPMAWLESAQRLLLHSSEIGSNAVGLKMPFVTSIANLRGELVNPVSLYEDSPIGADFASTAQQHALPLALATLLLLATALWTAWRTRDPVVAFVSGVACIFALTTPSGYYGSFFVLLVLIRPVGSATAQLCASALMFITMGIVFAMSSQGLIRMNGSAIYMPVSLLLLATLVWWLVQAAGAAPKQADRLKAQAPTAA
jgi:hypothetical protein